MRARARILPLLPHLAQVVKVDTVLNLIFIKGAVPGHDVRGARPASARVLAPVLTRATGTPVRRGRPQGGIVRVTDAIKRPTPAAAPVPTYLPAVHGPVPRELLAPAASKDPFVELED